MKRKRVCKGDRKLANNKNHINQLKARKCMVKDRISRIKKMESLKREAKANA